MAPSPIIVICHPEAQTFQLGGPECRDVPSNPYASIGLSPNPNPNPNLNPIPNLFSLLLSNTKTFSNPTPNPNPNSNLNPNIIRSPTPPLFVTLPVTQPSQFGDVGC